MAPVVKSAGEQLLDETILNGTHQEFSLTMVSLVVKVGLDGFVDVEDLSLRLVVFH